MKFKVRDITLIGLMSSLIAVGAFIKIPFLIVPITLQVLFVILSALLLEKEKSVLSVAIYLVLGLIGFPIFARGGGFSYILQPTFGYLIGFLFTAYFISKYKTKYNLYAVVLVGILITYLLGVTYFILIMYLISGKVFTISYLLVNLFLVFLPGDIFSGIIAIFISKKLNLKGKY